jgi:hypothetical protein
MTRAIGLLRVAMFCLGIVFLTVALLFGLPGMWLCERREREDY